MSVVGYDNTARAAAMGLTSVEQNFAALGETASRFHEIRRVVSNLGVFDFETPDHSMRLASLHPGVSVGEVVENTGFELVIPDAVPETRAPSAEDLRLIRDVLDPEGIARREVKE